MTEARSAVLADRRNRKKIQALIVQMAGENISWGYTRIQ
jgi:hypothetical protein